ncbi:hypothetical protein D9611_012972 [Ephemerocybe angulata]|uniref:Phospholipase/carboxylesterase/thioesterase domain-containing protein n=1 Tax=Ephemerocybe angulata TaxID=980116 RepID=A0A8H5C583_9AGAR|nr:hypothetical protein D9611_012972 [Tulosesus angulatus]
MSEYHIRESPNTVPKVKEKPKKASIPTPFSYWPSDDGTDENLLVLLHGLGDTQVPFGKLGHSLKLPQTAVLALRASEQIPYLYEDAYQWYPSFDALGEMLANPNPTIALELLAKVVNHLTDDLQWPLDRIHLFGFAQGGSVAAEFAILRWKEQLQAHRSAIAPSESTSESAKAPSSSLGSIVTVSGPLLSHPTLSSPSPTPILVAHRPSPSEEALRPDALKSFQRGFQSVTEAKLNANRQGMPGSRDEWEPIMRFWSEHLSRRKQEGLYEVMSGTSG